MKKTYDAELALREGMPQEMELKIDFVKVAESFAKSLSTGEYEKLKLGIIDPTAFNTFMKQLGISIAKGLIKNDPAYAGKTQLEVIQGYMPEFRKALEDNTRKHIKQLIADLKNIN